MAIIIIMIIIYYLPILSPKLKTHECLTRHIMGRTSLAHKHVF